MSSLDDDVDLDALLGLALEQIVQSVPLVSRPPEVDLGRDPPVVNVDLLLGHVDRAREVPEVVSAVDEPLGGAVDAEGRERVESVSAGPDALRGDAFHRYDELGISITPTAHKGQQTRRRKRSSD